MFKKLLKSLDSTPPTPKIGRLELPEVEDGGVFYISTDGPSVIAQQYSSDSEASSPRSPIAPWRRPSTPQPESFKPRRKTAVVQASSLLSPRYASSSAQLDDRKPVSIIPSPKAEARDSCSRSTTPQPGSSRSAGKSAPSSYSSSSAKPALKGILKPAPPLQPMTLHWQLLPYDPAHSKKLIYFDIARDVSFIRDHTRLPPTRLAPDDLAKAAAEIPLTLMKLRCAQIPHWDIVAQPTGPGGVRCVDVFRAIHDMFRRPLSETEKEFYILPERRARCEQAFRRRCRESPGCDADGMRRVDLLEGRTIFMGLRRPVESDGKPDEYWVLELGLPKGSR
ncbi:hypothetical protein WOLCODRAFT_136510 [Wolfiporia cocos MD-104 SS10]|uniref:DUF6699 domain-containing protein n=1 Tax=Wolfiporia cocos (strain MD-104) TaxID=742152 RepID=A0A2H3JC34_WOLCO|nr:hypothetical protein WOLCODRAFT_136510 [Wolfiporia cocos MD-104 SS10]